MVDGVWVDRRDPDVRCPRDYADILIAERFKGGWPWDLRDVDALEYSRFVHILGLEGEIKSTLMGLEPDEPFYREE